MMPVPNRHKRGFVLMRKIKKGRLIWKIRLLLVHS